MEGKERSFLPLPYPHRSFFGSRPIFRAGKIPKSPFLGLSLLPNSTETLAMQASVKFQVSWPPLKALWPNFQVLQISKKKKRKSNLLLSFPKTGNQVGSFGQIRKKLFFRFCRPILDIFGFTLLIENGVCWLWVLPKERHNAITSPAALTPTLWSKSHHSSH